MFAVGASPVPEPSSTAHGRRAPLRPLSPHSAPPGASDRTPLDAAVRAPLHPVIREMRITRLGEGLAARGAILPGPAARTAAAVARFAAHAATAGVSVPEVVGTHALRAAANPEVLLSRLSMPVRVLSGEEEARLGFQGAIAGLAHSGAAAGVVVLDIGGGSVEVTWGTSRAIRGSATLSLGSVILTNRFLRHDPPRRSEITGLRDHLARVLIPVLGPLRGRRGPLIGVGGTITTMAAIAQHLRPYDPDRVHGFRLSKPAVDRLTGELCRLPIAERRRLPGLQPERADIIAAGALVLQHIMADLGRRVIVVSEADLLWALVLGL
jgi:exopolyphosphatase / guanosine-5'-triphosphate,3'-diphosphate pyrophosphatase